MSELHATADAADPGSAASRAVRLSTDILQALLLGCVVGWVLDVPRRIFGVSFYTEQLLAVCLGLSLAISFINAKFSRAWLAWGCAAAALGICGYIAIRYEPLTYSIALLPLEGIIGSAILIVLVLEATRRTAGGVLVGIILVISAYVFVGPHMPGDFATKPVSFSRLLVYLGLDTNGMIGAILSVAVLIVVPFTLMGQVLGRTGGAAEGGHVTIDYRGPRCACGKYGCIEALAAGPAIALRARGKLASGGASRILELAGGLEQIRAEHVGHAFREGDAVARQVLEETAFLLTVWLGNIVDLLEPECMVVGGGVAELMSPFFADISKNLPRWAINQRAAEIPLVMARYGADAGIAGAAALCG